LDLASYWVANASGALVMGPVAVADKEDFLIETRGWPNGLYVVHLTTRTGERVYAKLVVAR
jgi:hypothetical protein